MSNTDYQPSLDPVQVLFEDDDLIVAVKPANLLSVPGKGEHKKDSAERRLFLDGRKFVRAAHRLDQDTSGLIIFGTSPAGHRAASMMFEARKVCKSYEAVSWIEAPETAREWTIDQPVALDWPNRPKHIVDPINGKPSKTKVRVLNELIIADAPAIRLALTPITGRSHQLRVHLSNEALPIVGDPLYCPDHHPAASRLHLHATELEFDHPLSGESLRFKSPAPF